MVSVAELERVVLAGELRDIERKYEPDVSIEYTDSEKEDIFELALSSPLHPVNIEIEQFKQETMTKAYNEADEIMKRGMRTVMIYAVVLWTFLIWAW